MIKKYKKLLYILLIIICLILLGFFNQSDAGYTRQIGVSGYSPYDQSINIAVLPKGSLISNRIGSSKRVLALSSKLEYNGNKGTLMYFWRFNGLPYIFSSYYDLRSNVNILKMYQGIPQSYYVCPYALNGDETSLSFGTCTIVNYTDGTRNSLKGFFETVKLSDYYYVDYDKSNNYGGSFARQWMSFCTSSSELDTTVCFRGGCVPTNENSACITLSGSLGINFDTMFEDISEFYISDGPGLDNPSSGNELNGPTEGENEGLWGDTIYQSCTNGQALNYFRNDVGYSDNMCFGGLNSFDLYSGDSYTVVPGNGLTVFEMYDYFSGYYSSFSEWYQSMEYNYLHRDSGLSPSLPAVFTTYFDINYGWGYKDVLEYCDLLLKQPLTGNLLDNHNISKEWKTFLCKRSTSPGSDNNFGGSGVNIGEDLSGIGSIDNVSNSGDVISGTNIVYGTNFINTYVNLLKKNFNIDKSNTTVGILPNYIIGFLLAILLFNFLRK